LIPAASPGPLSPSIEELLERPEGDDSLSAPVPAEAVLPVMWGSAAWYARTRYTTAPANRVVNEAKKIGRKWIVFFTLELS